MNDESKLIITLIVLGGTAVGLVRERVGPEVVLLAALSILVLAGVVSTEQALEGFASPSVIAIGSLFAIGAGLRFTGTMELLGHWIFGRPGKRLGMVQRTARVAGLSAFFNNTPLVAILMPMFVQWAKRERMSPSKALMPLSFAAMLGGTCTLIGTSTNLVVNNVMRQHGMPGMTMFEMSWVGLPLALIGVLYLASFGKRLLPDREDLLEHIETHPREYTVEMVVGPECPLIGQSVRKAGLRDLPGLYLFRIERGEQTITPVTPNEKILGGDLLYFSGIVSTVVDLQKIRGLVPVEHRTNPLAVKLQRPDHDASNPGGGSDVAAGIPAHAYVEETTAPVSGSDRQLCEVVISEFSPLVGHSIKDANFRAHYSASVIAVHRSGQKLELKIGQTVLEAGDTLLVDVDQDFRRRWRNSPDFILISGVEDSIPIAHERGWVAFVIFLAVIIGMTVVRENPAPVALAGAVLMVVCGCVPSREVHRAVDLPVLLLIAAALGIGRAMEESTAATWLASHLFALGPDANRISVLAAVFLLTSLLSQFLSNNATAALMGSITIAAASQLNIADPRPLLITVAVAASTSFATPIGYPTNVMVRSAGGYRFMDYVRVGLPLTILVGVVAVPMIHWLW